ncbi:hypothetical protein IQ07DRAFT_187481 [Pyrenochaeta sp. DS3sAY3a]|nr:hypothetical protein IQ07DRAFT_187481 [Pyrenochaeta sp. DS3sAY3a]
MSVESRDSCHSVVHVKEVRITTIGGKMSRVILHRINTYLAALVQFIIDLMFKSLGKFQSCACVVSAFADGGDESWTLCGGIPGRSRLVLAFVRYLGTLRRRVQQTQTCSLVRRGGRADSRRWRYGASSGECHSGT